MRDIDYERLGQRVRQYRIAAGLTQQQVADAIELEPSNLSHIERGKIKTSLATLVGIANALGTTPDMLLCDSLDHASPSYLNELADLLKGCTADELRIITATVRTMTNEFHP